MQDVMLDLETLDTKSTAAVVQIGACYFDRETGNIGHTFKVNVRPDFEDTTVSYDTIAWWLTQSDAARQSITDSPVDPLMAINSLSEFLQKGKAKYIWSHATFDVPILLHLYETWAKKFPIHYTKMRDIRTVMDLADVSLDDMPQREGTHHDALDDCCYQVGYVTQALRSLQ